MMDQLMDPGEEWQPPFDVEELDCSELYDLAEDALWLRHELGVLRRWLGGIKMLLEVAAPYVLDPELKRLITTVLADMARDVHLGRSRRELS